MADVGDAAGVDKSASAPGVVSGIMPLMLRAKGVIEEALRDAERAARRRREKAKPARPTAKK
jgi:hypothetical protein